MKERKGNSYQTLKNIRNQNMDILPEFLNNHYSLIKWLLILITMPAIIMFYIILEKEQYKEEIEPFKNSFTFLNGKFTSNIFSRISGDSFKAMHEGFPYTIKLKDSSRGGGYSPAMLTIFFERRTPFNMIVNSLASPGQWRSTKKVKTGDPDFDNRFVVYSNDSLPVSNYLKMSEIQEHISALFLLGYEELHIAKNKVRAERSFGRETDLAIEFDNTRLTKSIKSLAFLAKSLP
jgi:hypothetical protein